MEKITTPKDAGALRKAVYDFLKEEGFNLNLKQQGVLSALLKSIYEKKVITSVLSPEKPLKHEIVCPKCQGISIRSKGGFKLYRRKIKAAGGEVPPTSNHA